MRDSVRSGSGQSWEDAAQLQKKAPSKFLPDQRHRWIQAGLQLVGFATAESMIHLGFVMMAEEQQYCMAAVLCSGHGMHWAEHIHPVVPVLHSQRSAERCLRSVVPSSGHWVAERR
jgi:hypothetical protein